jgi:hypothetical protein
VGSEGDFYVPGLAADGRTGFVPGAPDLHRRLFLCRAAKLDPGLLSSLRHVDADDLRSLVEWTERWHLTDYWCLASTRDTARWYAAEPEAEGWEFRGKGIFAGFFPFPIEPFAIWAILF